MKPESPLVVIQASRMKENENSGLESDSEVDKFASVLLFVTCTLSVFGFVRQEKVVF